MPSQRAYIRRRWLAAVITVATAALVASAPVPEPARGDTAPPGVVYTPTAPTRGALVSDGPTNRYLLGGTWLFRPDLLGVGLGAGYWRGSASTQGWSPVTLPNSYNVGDYSQASMNGWTGWYRRDFVLPANAFAAGLPAAAKSWVVQFEAVNYSATVWLNGRRLGSHTGGYLPFELTLKGLRAGVNHLVVRVNNQRTQADNPPSNNLWWNYGGISDVVYLRPVARANLDSVMLRPQLPCPTCAAQVTAQPTVTNPTSRAQTVRLSGTYGSVPIGFGTVTIPAGATWRPTQTVIVRHPRLWAPGHPALYSVRLTLRDPTGHTLGGYTYQSGIRSIKVSPGGQLTLNGRALHLDGINIHEQSLATGEALSMAQMQGLMSTIENLGATIIRAHVPLNPELEQMADEAGIMLWSEVPVYQTSKSYLADPGWRSRAVALVRANIQANRNHPSIAMWSIGNELPTPPTAGEAAYIAQASAAAKQLDPDRPVALAVKDWPGIACQPAYAPLDVIGINEYFGWFDAGGGATDYRGALSPFLDSRRACYPHQALMITEYGFNGNRNGPVEARGTYAFQVNSIQYHLAVFAAKPWLSGTMYYNLQDFAARPGWDGSNPLGTPPFVTNGLLDGAGNQKPAFAAVAAAYHAAQQIAPLP